MGGQEFPNFCWYSKNLDEFSLIKNHKIIIKIFFIIAIIFFIYENSSRFLEYQQKFGNSWPPISNNEILYK
jgi:hypothetical protein